MMNKKITLSFRNLSILLGALIVVSLAVTIFVLPASGAETTETRLKEKFSSEFNELSKVSMLKTEKVGTYYVGQYALYNKEGKRIAVVDVSEENMDILGIHFFDRELTVGEPKIQLDEARKQAQGYIAKYFQVNLEDYELVEERLGRSSSDVGDQDAYVYQFSWQRIMDGVYLADSIYIELNAITNEALLVLGPTGKCLVPESTKGFEAAFAKREDMINKATSQYSSPEELYSRYRGDFQKSDIEEYLINTKEEACLSYGPDPKTGDGPGMLLWNVKITTEFYDKTDMSSAAWSNQRLYIISADTGEILATDGTI